MKMRRTVAPPQPVHVRPDDGLPHRACHAVDKVHVGDCVFDDLLHGSVMSANGHEQHIDAALSTPKQHQTPHEKKQERLTSAIAPNSNPSPKSLARNVRRSTVCMTALPSGRPSVTASVLDRYMNEMAGARCDGSWMTACREMKTADWAIPVPKPLGKMYSDSQMLVLPCQRSMSRR